MYEPINCMICGEPRAELEKLPNGMQVEKNTRWTGVIGLYTAPSVTPDVFTVCPKCRAKPLKEILERAVEKMRGELSASYDDARARMAKV